MRLSLLMSLAALLAVSLAWAAPPGPLVAGTAPGGNGALSPDYATGVHYLNDWTVVGSIPIGSPPPQRNYTAPYDEWPDPGRVPGIKSAMTRDLVIFSSKKRNR